MSQYERNMKYLNDKRIIYRRNPITDKPSAKFEWGNFYETGTHECYALFQTKAKINTYKSLTWHLYVFWYLNDALDPDEFITLTQYLCSQEHDFFTFQVTGSLF